jgi:hypothetical protein
VLCSFENPPEARFCGDCGEPFHIAPQGLETSQVLSAPTTLREPARDSPEALARLDLQRDMAAADAVRFAGLGRLISGLAREMAKSAKTPAIVNLAAARATILARPRHQAESGATVDEPSVKGIRAPLRSVCERAESVATDAKRDGLRTGQLAKEIDDRAAGAATSISEMASGLESALDTGESEWTMETSLEKLGKLAVLAEERGSTALRAHSDLASELDALTGAGKEAAPH